MERIMPIDLENAQPRKVLRGYDPREVDDLLTAAAHSLELALVDAAGLRDQTERLRAEVAMLRQEQETIRDALVAAQRAAEQIRSDATRQAQIVIEEARLSAANDRADSHKALSEMQWETARLKEERQRFLNEFRGLLDRYRKDLENTPDIDITPHAVVMLSNG